MSDPPMHCLRQEQARAQPHPQGDNLRFYPPPLEVFSNYVHRIYLLFILVVVGSCSCRVEILVFFRSPKSKTEHSTVQLRLKTSTKTILSTTSTKHYNYINIHDLFKYYQIPSRAVNGEIALEFTHFLTSADYLQKNDKKMRHPFDGFR